VRLLARTPLAAEKELPTIEIKGDNSQPKSLSLFITNTNKLVLKLNALKARKYKGRPIVGRKSSIIRKSLRLRGKERGTL
jgi:hypothetical protein